MRLHPRTYKRFTTDDLTFTFLELDLNFLRFATKFKIISIIDDDSNNSISTTMIESDEHQIDHF